MSEEDALFRLPEEIEFFEASQVPKTDSDPFGDRAGVIRAFEVASIMAAAYNAELDREAIRLFEVPTIMCRLIQGFRETLHGDAWDLLASRLLEEIAERPHEPFK